MTHRPKKGVLRVYAPDGEWQVGPRNTVHFQAEPIPLAGRSCAIDFLGTLLFVRIEEVGADGIAHGIIVGRAKDRRQRPEVPLVRADDLIAWGLMDIAREAFGV